jgi:hypothetical protein
MSIDAILDRQHWIDVIERCTDKGVTERPPVAGKSYAAFAVHPPHPGILLALAIAHRDGENFIVDLVKGDIRIADSAPILRRYGISTVFGADDDIGLPLAQAVSGVIAVLRRQ